MNDAIRRGLSPRPADEPEEPYRVKVHHAKLRAGIDPTAMNRLADELEDESVIQKRTKPGRVRERRPKGGK